MGTKLVLSKDEANNRNSKKKIRTKRMTFGSKIIAELNLLTSVINTQKVHTENLIPFIGVEGVLMCK